jgi:hypothetical protein
MGGVSVSYVLLLMIIMMMMMIIIAVTLRLSRNLTWSV